MTLIEECRSLGVSITVQADRLRIKAPPGVMTPALRDRLAAHKPALLAHLNAPEPPEPSAPCPLPAPPTPERAEKRQHDAIERIIQHLDTRFPSGTVMRASQLAELRRSEREVELSAAADEAGAELAFESLWTHAERVRDITASIVGQFEPAEVPDRSEETNE